MQSDYAKEIFTPYCLVGVETDKGFITNVAKIAFYDISKPSYYANTTESLSEEDMYDINNLNFFISDYSDDVVPLEDYVEIFYEGQFTR